jgi:hypothetical protein
MRLTRLTKDDCAVRCAAGCCGVLCPEPAATGDAVAATHIHAQQLRHVTGEVKQPRIVHACNAALHAGMYSVDTSATASQCRLRVALRTLMKNAASVIASTVNCLGCLWASSSRTVML